jgi:hydrogenase nickel incorporation protein HypA/HybF
MHEMSIVEALLDSVRTALRSHPHGRVAAVEVRIGSLRLVVPETLQFCYRAATRDTELAGSDLHVTTVHATARCRQCRAGFAVEENWFECPKCGAMDGDLQTGNELELIGLELEQIEQRVPA